MVVHVRNKRVMSEWNQKIIAEPNIPEDVGVFQKSLKMTAREYLENSTIAGCAYLVKPGRHKLERLMWITVILMAIGISVFMVLRIWNEFTKNPTIVSLDTPQYPVREVPFPAIALCNINKLSKKRVLEYAKILSVKLNKPVDYLMKEQMFYLGRHIDHDIEGFEDYLTFMENVLSVDSDETTGLYDTKSKMKMLSPTCDEMLIRCRWMEDMYDCKDIFSMRRTAEGFCCTFNYRQSIDQQIENHDIIGGGELRLDKVGIGSGLSIVANPHIEDYYYTLRSSEGFNVLVFDPHDYPEVSSGSLIERVASVNRIRFLDIRPFTVYSVPDVKRFSINQRKCMFNDDNLAEYFGYYSYSNCIVECRMRSVLALCKCMPFFMPNNSSSDIQYCNLAHIPCLHKYKTKFRTVLTGDFINSKFDGLEEEHEDGLVCPECFPDCSMTSYRVHATSSVLMKKDEHSDLLSGLDLANHTVIHFFYGTSDINIYKQDVVYYWFEIVSSFGGICGLFIGFSIISVVEFIYYFTLRFFSILRLNGFKIFGRF